MLAVKAKILSLNIYLVYYSVLFVLQGRKRGREKETELDQSGITIGGIESHESEIQPSTSTG